MLFEATRPFIHHFLSVGTKSLSSIKFLCCEEVVEGPSWSSLGNIPSDLRVYRIICRTTNEGNVGEEADSAAGLDTGLLQPRPLRPG